MRRARREAAKAGAERRFALWRGLSTLAIPAPWQQRGDGFLSVRPKVVAHKPREIGAIG